jgi:hypothetical protein
MSAASLTFSVLHDRVAICRLPANAPIPPWAAGPFVSIGRTATELSIVCRQTEVPANVQQERDRAVLGIDGVVPMTTVGLLAALCSALAVRSVPVFVVSTFDTDYLLVTVTNLPAARLALTGLGHQVVGDDPR